MITIMITKDDDKGDDKKLKDQSKSNSSESRTIHGMGENVLWHCYVL